MADPLPFEIQATIVAAPHDPKNPGASTLTNEQAKQLVIESRNKLLPGPERDAVDRLLARKDMKFTIVDGPDINNHKSNAEQLNSKGVRVYGTTRAATNEILIAAKPTNAGQPPHVVLAHEAGHKIIQLTYGNSHARPWTGAKNGSADMREAIFKDAIKADSAQCKGGVDFTKQLCKDFNIDSSHYKTEGLESQLTEELLARKIHIEATDPVKAKALAEKYPELDRVYKEVVLKDIKTRAAGQPVTAMTHEQYQQYNMAKTTMPPERQTQLPQHGADEKAVKPLKSPIKQQSSVYVYQSAIGSEYKPTVIPSVEFGFSSRDIDRLPHVHNEVVPRESNQALFDAFREERRADPSTKVGKQSQKFYTTMNNGSQEYLVIGERFVVMDSSNRMAITEVMTLVKEPPNNGDKALDAAREEYKAMKKQLLGGAKSDRAGRVSMVETSPIHPETVAFTQLTEQHTRTVTYDPSKQPLGEAVKQRHFASATPESNRQSAQARQRELHPEWFDEKTGKPLNEPRVIPKESPPKPSVAATPESAAAPKPPVVVAPEPIVEPPKPGLSRPTKPDGYRSTPKPAVVPEPVAVPKPTTVVTPEPVIPPPPPGTVMPHASTPEAGAPAAKPNSPITPGRGARIGGGLAGAVMAAPGTVAAIEEGDGVKATVGGASMLAGIGSAAGSKLAGRAFIPLAIAQTTIAAVEEKGSGAADDRYEFQAMQAGKGAATIGAGAVAGTAAAALGASAGTVIVAPIAAAFAAGWAADALITVEKERAVSNAALERAFKESGNSSINAFLSTMPNKRKDIKLKESGYPDLSDAHTRAVVVEELEKKKAELRQTIDNDKRFYKRGGKYNIFYADDNHKRYNNEVNLRGLEAATEQLASYDETQKRLDAARAVAEAERAKFQAAFDRVHLKKDDGFHFKANYLVGENGKPVTATLGADGKIKAEADGKPVSGYVTRQSLPEMDKDIQALSVLSEKRPQFKERLENLKKLKAESEFQLAQQEKEIEAQKRAAASAPATTPAPPAATSDTPLATTPVSATTTTPAMPPAKKESILEQIINAIVGFFTMIFESLFGGGNNAAVNNGGAHKSSGAHGAPSKDPRAVSAAAKGFDKPKDIRGGEHFDNGVAVAPAAAGISEAVSVGRV